MKIFKKILTGAAILTLSAAAHAAPVNVGGVVFNPDAPLDFSAFGGIIRQTIDSATGEVSGFGLISSINGTGVSTFCPGPCQLTFQFEDFMPTDFGVLPSLPGQTIDYTGGIVNVYVHAPTAIDPNNPLSLNFANTGLNGGQLWLALAGHEAGINNTSFVGKVQTDGTGRITGLQGNGQLDVTGGLAFAYFDTNTKSFGSDLTFQAGFTTFLPNNNLLDAVGNGTFAGDTVGVPEPTSLTLLGLGLLSAGVARRRRKQAK